jgi:hypothetical protein
MVQVEVIVALWPFVRLPSAQGKAEVQAPELETNVKPEGVGSATETALAVDGPLFVTTIV